MNKQALDEILRREYRLGQQQDQVERLLVRAKQHLETARRFNDRVLGLEALARCEQLEQELARIQEQWEQLRAEYAALLQQEARLGQAGRPAAASAALTLPAEESSPDVPPAEHPHRLIVLRERPEAFMPPLVQPETSRQDNRLFTLLCALAAVVLLVPLVLWFVSHPRPGVVAHPTPSPAIPTPTAPPSNAPAFIPNGSAPTSSDCRDAVSFPCYSPEQMQGAFHLNALYHQGYDGHGQTIVILGVGHTTTLQQDLHHFDQAWGLPDPPDFHILQPLGPPLPYTCFSGRDDLEAEDTLDVEWAHALAPGANIVLLIWSNGLRGAPAYLNCGFQDIEGAVSYALDHQLGQIISISYGGSELDYSVVVSTRRPLQPGDYAHAHEIFQRAAAQHVTVLAASGDTGAVNNLAFLGDGSGIQDVSWPASDPYVLAVGGTSIQISDANGTMNTEQAWNDQYIGASGGGLSAAFAEPDYQREVANQKMLRGKRGVPDVAFPASLSFALYLSSASGLGANHPEWRHWTVTGGTSASAPCWAGIIALANQMKGAPLGFIQPALYHLRGQGMNDITLGNNSFAGVQGYQTQPGYDLVTGWGTPIADQLLPALIKQAASTDGP